MVMTSLMDSAMQLTQPLDSGYQKVLLLSEGPAELAAVLTDPKTPLPMMSTIAAALAGYSSLSFS